MKIEIKFGYILYAGVLALILTILKLLGVISWSWWWVTLPLWGINLAGIIIVVVFGIIFYIREEFFS